MICRLAQGDGVEQKPPGDEVGREGLRRRHPGCPGRAVMKERTTRCQTSTLPVNTSSANTRLCATFTPNMDTMTTGGRNDPRGSR